jgi:hypothetical protein
MEVSEDLEQTVVRKQLQKAATEETAEGADMSSY